MSMMRLLCTKYFGLERESVFFPSCRKNEVNGDSTRFKKLKLQFKVAGQVPFLQVQFVSRRVQLPLQDFFSFTSPLHKFSFFCHPSLHDFFSQPPITFLMVICPLFKRSSIRVVHNQSMLSILIDWHCLSPWQGLGLCVSHHQKRPLKLLLRWMAGF